MNAKVNAMADEMNLLRNELIQVKSAHAVLHQTAVDTAAGNAKLFSEQTERIAKLEQRIDSVINSEEANMAKRNN